MSRAIYKYPFPNTGLVTLALPKASEPLCVHDQDGIPNLWVEVDQGAPNVEKRFLVIGTGWKFPNGNFTYIGTAFCGSLVWHVYMELS